MRSCKEFLGIVGRFIKQVYTIGIVLFFTALWGGLTILLGTIEAFLLRKSPGKGDQIHSARVCRFWWAKSILFFHAVRLENEILESPDPEEGLIVISNHQSALDILVCIIATKNSMVFFAKKELKKVPVLGWAAWVAGTVYIDRKKGFQDQEALHAIEQAIHKKNHILIYPEGTRSETGALLPFKRGAFMLAIKTQTPLYVMSICNSRDLLSKRGLQIKSGTVKIVSGPRLSVKNLKDEARFELSEEARRLIQKNLDQWTDSENNRV